MKCALIFLNGYYDPRHPEFYRQEIQWGMANDYPLICADGGIRAFDAVNALGGTQYHPNVLIGDLDSFDDTLDSWEEAGTCVIREWVGKVDKDYTDGQLAVAYAIEEYHCEQILIYGGLPRADGYETDHFLGNLKLMRFGLKMSTAKRATIENYSAEMRDRLQTIHFVDSHLRMVRQNAGLQRVSLIAEHAHVHVAHSQNLRWDLAGLHIQPDSVNALRNEFVPEADWATIRLKDESDPVYVIHNW